jgi:hypothetical protein
MAYATYLLADRVYETCSRCGGPKTKGALFCKKCKTDTAAAAWGACRSCGGRIRAAYEQCRSCYDKERIALRPTCVDCGQSTKQYAYDHFAQRCWTCEVKRRRSLGVQSCTVEDCVRVHMARGLCRNHYNQQHQRNRITRAGGLLIQSLKEWPCQLCGYSMMKCEAARLVPGGPYRPGNVMALCVRCHREVDAGLTPPPTPPTVEEIMASRV